MSSGSEYVFKLISSSVCISASYSLLTDTKETEGTGNVVLTENATSMIGNNQRIKCYEKLA